MGILGEESRLDNDGGNRDVVKGMKLEYVVEVEMIRFCEVCMWVIKGKSYMKECEVMIGNL